MLAKIHSFLILIAAAIVCGSESDDLRNVLRSELIKSLKNSRPSDGVILPEHKIIGGWSATTGLVSYQAFIKSFLHSGGSYECGGSLITRRHVLTAAHCLIGTAGAIISLGTTNSNLIFGIGVVSFLVEANNFIIHPDYDDMNLYNDIAIIRLPSSVTISLSIRPIALPTNSMISIDYFAGKKAVISGFGKTSDEFWDMGSDKLQMADVNITRLSDCQQFWHSIYSINETQICTSFEGSGTCQGDSGGPLAVEVLNRAYLVGITSFGSRLCTQKAPSVYTNVASYLHWVKAVTALM